MVDKGPGRRPPRKNPKQPRRRTGKKAIEQARRQRKALELRTAGLTLDEIAQRLGYAGRQGACAAIQTAMDRNEAAGVAELRRVHGAELDALREAIWPKAIRGNEEAIRTALKVLDSKARLFGLEAARKFEVRGSMVRPQDVKAALLEELRLLEGLAAPATAPEPTGEGGAG